MSTATARIDYHATMALFKQVKADVDTALGRLEPLVADAKAAIAQRAAARLKGCGEALEAHLLQQIRPAGKRAWELEQRCEAALQSGDTPAHEAKAFEVLRGLALRLQGQLEDAAREKLRKTQKALKLAREKLADAGDEAKRLLGDAEVLLDADAGRAAEARAALTQAHEQGLAAQRQRDAGALTAARKAAAAVPARPLQEALQKIDAELARVAERAAGKTLAAATAAQIKAGLKPLTARRHAMAGDVDACVALQQRIAALQVDTIDPRRAATVLELERDAHADLERALQGDDAQMLKQLDALARKRKLVPSGRELLARLRKAQLV
jgi:hypothetical protein